MALDTKRIRKPPQKLRKLLKKMPKQPTPKDVHDLRTNTRRLEATLAALSLDSKGRGRRLLRDLARVRRRAGKVRDLDVLTGHAATLHPDGDENCSVQLIEHLGAERRRHGKKLHATAAKHGKTVRKRLKKTSAYLERLITKGNTEWDPAEASAKVTASALKLESELAIPAALGRKNLHSYRLKVKKLHNLLRMADNTKKEEFISMLGEAKDAIGEWHDWEELLGMANDVLDHGARCTLVRELKRICDEKYEHALARTESMRKKYLKVSQQRRNKGHFQPPAEAVWTATTAIAA
jgi:CHAD domain-containing protein